ncbi:hypothetical protein [Caballeronia sp. dw_19]|uniref:hypothetical protein n=1 Tax=Caballeronia sp. dw_19 TaxID=2719791 RepID=UPI001BD3B261|nr:hypothetical protein [Caballeronia sp. dw_19]
MNKVIVSVLSLIGGVLFASGLIAHLTVIEQMGIPLDKQAFAGGMLLLIALGIHFLMGGRSLPWQR